MNGGALEIMKITPLSIMRAVLRAILVARWIWQERDEVVVRQAGRRRSMIAKVHKSPPPSADILPFVNEVRKWFKWLLESRDRPHLAVPVAKCPLLDLGAVGGGASRNIERLSTLQAGELIITGA